MRPILCVVVAAALVAPAGSSAKGLVEATVCGASGCRTVEDLATLHEIPAGEAFMPLGAPAPYYRVRLVSGEPGGRRVSVTAFYVSSAKAMAWVDDGLVRLHPIFGPRANGVMRRITNGIEPYPAPRITTAIVGGRRVAGDAARSYASLFTVGKQAPLAASSDDWVAVDLRSSPTSPWTEGTSELMFSPSESMIEIAAERFRIPEGIAADIAGGRTLREESSRTLTWAWLALGGVGVLVAVSLARILPFKS